MQSYEKKEFFPIEKSGTLRGKLYLCCFKKRNNMKNQKLYDLRDEFLRTWPLERVKGMSVEESEEIVHFAAKESLEAAEAEYQRLIS